MNLHALHGFFGSGKDFQFLKELGLPLFTPSLFSKNPEIPWKHSLKDFGKAFNEHVGRRSSNILIGYSLGGRLALHALIEDPALYQAAVIISAHPGLKSADERVMRLQEDQKRAERLREIPFKMFTEEWDSLPLFAGSPPVARDEADFDQEALVHGLTKWSLAKQDDLQKEIEALPLPLLFIAGEKDTKFSALAQKLSLKNPLSRIAIVPEANHRVPWQAKDAFVALLAFYLNR